MGFVNVLNVVARSEATAPTCGTPPCLRRASGPPSCGGCLPLFFFDTNHGTYLTGVTLADKAAAKRNAVSRIAEMTMDLPGGHHEITVLVKGSSGIPLFRVALTLDCISRTKAAARHQLTAPNKVVIVSSMSVMLN